MSYTGININLFNLIPISPLDGGRITQVVGAWFKYVGLGMLFVFTVVARQPALLLIWILVLDGFDRMAIWLRPLVAFVLGVSMTLLMLLGFSDQPIYVDCVDVAVATLATFVYWMQDDDRCGFGAAICFL